MSKRVWMSAAVILWAVSLAWAAQAKEPKPPPDMPDLTESAKLAEKMPKTVSGAVTLDGKGAGGVRVTDGVQFVTTDEEGNYSLDIKPDPLVPYMPSRTISICWPSGTWPGGAWWVRLKDVKDPAKVNFSLAKCEQKLPVCVAFGTDPHDAFRRSINYIFRDEIARAGRHVAFAVAGGDLGYLGFGNADKDYAAMQIYTNGFPVPLLHCIGNHDVVGIHSKWWAVPHEIAGNGAFIKYLNPIRWSFDYADIHFVGLDWALIDEKGHMQCGVAKSAIDWLEEDLKSLPEGTSVYFFNHQGWSPHQRFFDVCAKYGVKLCLGGHSHRNMFLGNHGGVEYWTKMSLYTLLYVDKDGFEFVDRCIYKGGRNGWDGHWGHNHRGCALYNDRGAQEKQRGEHVGLENVTLDSGSKTIKTVKGPTYDVRFGARGVGKKPARRFGLRLTGADGKVHEFSYDDFNNMLNLMGRQTYFNPEIPVPGPGAKEQESWVEMRIFVMPDRVRVLVNSRLHYQKYIKPGEAKRIEFFAEDGSAEFGRVDVYQRTWPKDYKPRATANTG